MIKHEQTIEIDAHTPFGVDKYWLRLNDDGSGYFSSGIDRYDIPKENFAIAENTTTVCFDIATPLAANVLVYLQSNGTGKLSMDAYLTVPLSFSLDGKNK
jgi:hypothetical protein